MDIRRPTNRPLQPIQRQSGALLPSPRPSKTTAASTSQPTDRSIEIKIELPRFVRFLSPARIKKLLAKLRKKPTRKIYIVSGIAAIVLVATGITGYYTQQAKSDVSNVSPASGLPQGTPDYPTISPAGKDIAELGGWTLVSPQNTDPVYAYVDRIGDTSISVSQQPLPKALQDNASDQVEKLAQQSGANEKITIGDTTVHFGSASNKSQSAILHKNNLLILIKSTSEIDKSQWIDYIRSLK